MLIGVIKKDFCIDYFYNIKVIEKFYKVRRFSENVKIDWLLF